MAGLIFGDFNRQPFDWPDDDLIDLTDTPIALYPYIPAEMPGVQLLRSDLPPTPTPAPTMQDEPDWAQMADEATTNADLDHADHLPTPVCNVLFPP